MKPAYDIARSTFAQGGDNRVHRGGKTRGQKRQSKGQRNALMLEIAFADTGGMRQEQAAKHGHFLIATHHPSAMTRTCAAIGLPE